MEARKSIFESVKDGVVGTIKGTGDVAKSVVDTVSGTLTHTIKRTSTISTSLIETVSDVGRAAIRGVTDVDGDLKTAAKGAVIDALRKTKETGMEATDAIKMTASSV